MEVTPLRDLDQMWHVSMVDVIACAIFGDSVTVGNFALSLMIDLRCRPYNTGHTVWC